MASAREVTEAVLSAWDEESGEPVEQTETEQTEPEQPEQPEQTPEPEEQESDEQPEEAEPDEQEGDGEDEGGEDGDEQPGFSSDDPEVQAYLAKYQGDPERAIKAAAAIQRSLSRQGQEKFLLEQRVAEMEAELAQARLHAQPMSTLLSAEQQQWVETAAESGNARSYVQAAVQQGDFEMARAVCEAVSGEAPYEAIRLGQWVDQAETLAMQQYSAQFIEAEPAGYDKEELFNILTSNFPDMPQHQQEMISLLGKLGPDHPTVQAANSPDPMVAGHAIVNLYEIARASSATLNEARSNVKAQQRAAATSAREAAVVSSGRTTASGGETPRSRKIAPGLTLEQLDEAWENA